MPVLNSITFRNSWLLAALVVLLGSGFAYAFFGFYYSEYEGLNIALLSGSLTPGMPFRSLYFSGNLVISWFYSFFYEYLPGVEWISWFEYLWMFLAALLAMVVLNITMNRKFSTVVKVVLMFVVFLLVFAEHQVHLIYTRVAYLVCGFSLISLIVFFEDAVAIKKKWWTFILLNFFFGIGTLIRNEAAIACFLLMLPFAFIYLRKVRVVALLFVLPFMVVSGQSLFLVLDIRNANNTEFYKQVEPDIEEQFIARKNIVPLSSMKTYRDTVLYQMAQEMTLSDPRVMTPAYLRSLIQPEGYIFTDARQWRRVANELFQIFAQYWYLVAIVLLLSGALYTQYNFNHQLFDRLYYLVFVVSFWGLIIAQTYVDKVNERSWLPYIGLFIFCHLVLLVKNVRTGYSRNHLPAIATGTILFAIHFYSLGIESKRLEEDFKFQQHQLASVKSVATNRVLVVNSSSFNFLFLSNRPFRPFNFSAFKRVYITDSYIMPFLPYYKRYIESECDCSMYAYPAIWKFLDNVRQEVIVVSQPNRLNMVREYLAAIHGLTLNIKMKELLQVNQPSRSYEKNFVEGIEAFTFEN